MFKFINEKLHTEILDVVLIKSKVWQRWRMENSLKICEKTPNSGEGL